MIFETLYALDKKGKIRVFECAFKLIIHSDTHYEIITQTGLLGGKKTVKRSIVTKGKGTRTIKEQVQLEANALWKEKRYEGYKTIEELKSKVSLVRGQPVNDVQIALEQTHVQNAYKAIGIDFNSNPDWHPLCMLAEKWKDHKDKIEYPVIVQPKLDGVRCTAFKDSTGKIRLMSRGGEYYQVPHIEKILEEYYNSNQNLVYFDGEIYKHGIPQQTISGAVRTEVDNNLFGDAKQEWLEYHIYDVIPMDYNLKQLNRELLRTQIFRWFKKEDKLDNIKFVGSMIANSEEEVIALHDNYVDQGYEGAMVRDQEAEYLWSFRDKRLLKLKAFEDAEFEIIGYEIDPHKSIGESFVFILKNDINDRTFKARPTGSNEMKEEWFKLMNHEGSVHYGGLVGKNATVKFKGRSVDGIPVHGSVRHKDTKCLVTNIRKQYE